jgi:N-acetyl-alpha-D-glucosaminyl L-malate synthase BshA
MDCGDDRMKIGITCYPTFGGSGTIATDLGKHLSRRGHEIHFIASSLPYRLRFHSSPNLYFHEVEKVNYPLFESSPYILLLASKMAEIARTYSLDILHVHYAIPHAVSAHLAKQILGRHSPKIITTLHGTDVTLIGNLRSLKPLTRFSIIKSNGITTVSNFLKKRTEEIFNIRNDIRVIPNFIDPDDFNRKIKKCTCIPRKSPGEKTIIHISNFRKVKRIPDVISVFKGIADCLPARLLLVGEGPETLVAQEKIREYGLEQRVLFLGLVDNVSPVISHTDLLLQISDHESFGLSSLEALACGVPVIGTCGSGLSEVVVDGKNGCLSPPGNTDKMILDACTLLTNREKYVGPEKIFSLAYCEAV